MRKKELYRELRLLIIKRVPYGDFGKTTTNIVRELCCYNKEDLLRLGFSAIEGSLQEIVLRQLHNLAKQGVVLEKLENAGKVRRFQNYSYAVWRQEPQEERTE